MDVKRFKSEIIPLRQALHRTALRILENEEDAEDAVQETFLKLWNVRNKVFAADNPEGFAMQVAKNCCLDRLRQRKPTLAEQPEAYWLQDGNTPLNAMEAQDTVRLIKQIIDCLPALQQAIIRMRDIEGYEIAEIAAITDTLPSAVTVNLSRARKKVRELYSKIINYKSDFNERYT